MTKTQISVRVSPDTLAAIDAEAKRLGISRGALIDRWLTSQAVATHAQPIEAQAWYRAGALAAKARDRLEMAVNESGRFNVAHLLTAIYTLADAIDVLAGTAPDDAR